MWWLVPFEGNYIKSFFIWRMSRQCEANTNVILVCVTNKQSRVLTHDKFFKIFGPFGKILRVNIMSHKIDPHIWESCHLEDLRRVRQPRECPACQDEHEWHRFRGRTNEDERVRESIVEDYVPGEQQRRSRYSIIWCNQDYTILRQKIEEKNVKGPNSVTSPVYSV